MEAESVGQRFSQLIQQLGMSKNAFAMSLDKTATVIQHLVDERNKPGFDLMCKVFEVYPNVSKDWLLLGRGPMLLPEAGAPVATLAPAAPSAVAQPPAATPHFPEPLFTVSAARSPLPEVPAAPTAPVAMPAQEPIPAPMPTSAGVAMATAPQLVATPTPALGIALPEVQLAVPSPVPGPAPTPPAAPAAALDTTALTAALHAQYLQHQLALAEQRNQHMLEQQALMQQMLDLLRRPV